MYSDAHVVDSAKWRHKALYVDFFCTVPGSLSLSLSLTHTLTYTHVHLTDWIPSLSINHLDTQSTAAYCLETMPRCVRLCAYKCTTLLSVPSCLGCTYVRTQCTCAYVHAHVYIRSSMCLLQSQLYNAHCSHSCQCSIGMVESQRD